MGFNNAGALVAFGGGKFLVLSHTNALVSADGVAWTEQTTGYQGSTLTFGNGRFVSSSSSYSSNSTFRRFHFYRRIRLGGRSGAGLTVTAFAGGQFIGSRTRGSTPPQMVRAGCPAPITRGSMPWLSAVAATWRQVPAF